MAKRRNTTRIEPPPPMIRAAPPDRRILLVISLTLTILVFVPSLQNGFVYLDDHVYVFENPAIKAFTWKNAREILTQSFVGTYLPMTMLSYMADYRLFGLEPFGY